MISQVLWDCPRILRSLCLHKLLILSRANMVVPCHHLFFLAFIFTCYLKLLFKCSFTCEHVSQQASVCYVLIRTQIYSICDHVCIFKLHFLHFSVKFLYGLEHNAKLSSHLFSIDWGILAWLFGKNCPVLGLLLLLIRQNRSFMLLLIYRLSGKLRGLIMEGEWIIILGIPLLRMLFNNWQLQILLLSFIF